MKTKTEDLITISKRSKDYEIENFIMDSLRFTKVNLDKLTDKEFSILLSGVNYYLDHTKYDRTNQRAWKEALVRDALFLTIKDNTDN